MLYLLVMAKYTYWLTYLQATLPQGKMGKPKPQQTKEALKRVNFIKYKYKTGCGSGSLADKLSFGKTEILIP